MRQYLKQRRINKTKMAIAGLTEKQRILIVITDGEHRSYDRENLISTSQRLSMLKMQLEILTEET